MQEELDKIKSKFDIYASSSTHDKCISLETKIVDLNQVIWNYEKSLKSGLDNVLISQRCVNDKNGLRYSKFENSSQIKKTIFVKPKFFCNMFNLEKYVIMCIIERHITKIIYVIIKDA